MSAGSERRPFELHRHKSFFRPFLITIGVDIVLSAAVIAWFRYHADLIVFRGGIIPAFVVINLGLAVACRFAAPRFYLFLLINSVLSALIFGLMLFVLQPT